MKYEHVDNDEQLREFCESAAGAKCLAFDTEFVSEDTYRPHLCLIQVAADDRLAVIDPIAIADVTPFWHLLAKPGHETIVHAGREEFRFCLDAIGQRPTNWFDIQIAAGFVGLEYPAAYSTLISKLVGKNLPKGETRTDWRRRPLSDKQLEYALQDVVYLRQIRDILAGRLDELDRREWLADELDSWLQQIEHTENTEQWRRVSGSAGLSARKLAIIREVWRWRDAEAASRNSPPKRILRDDLIVEIARRQTDNVQRIRSVRGMEHRHLQRHLEAIADCVRRAEELPDHECPRPARRGEASQPSLVLLGQFLSTALGCICRTSELAPGLVGSVQDTRDLIAHRLGLTNSGDQPPRLSEGWRARVIGPEIEKLLRGELGLRVVDPRADQPLSLESFDLATPNS
ncbi:MAG: ribonuclease D [Planctomycetota bacterium]|nr:ribonuclease D [Planctomycetota bacterium]